MCPHKIKLAWQEYEASGNVAVQALSGQHDGDGYYEINISAASNQFTVVIIDSTTTLGSTIWIER